MTFEKVAKAKLSELTPQQITDADYQNFVSGIWCMRRTHSEKNVFYMFLGFNTQSNTLSMCNFEMPTFVRPDFNQLKIEWDKDEDGNLKNGSWMSGFTFVRQRNRIDIFAGTDGGDIMHIISTAKGWAVVAEGAHEPTSFLTKTGTK